MSPNTFLGYGDPICPPNILSHSGDPMSPVPTFKPFHTTCIIRVKGLHTASS